MISEFCKRNDIKFVEDEKVKGLLAKPKPFSWRRCCLQLLLYKGYDNWRGWYDYSANNSAENQIPERIW